MQPTFFIYRQKGRTLKVVAEFHTLSECLRYFDDHAEESLWYMDVWDKTMRHNSHFSVSHHTTPLVEDAVVQW